jgi:hypothetical protein
MGQHQLQLPWAEPEKPVPVDEEPCIPLLGEPLEIEGGAVRVDPYFAGAHRVRVQVDAPEALERALDDPQVTAVRIGGRGDPYREPESRVRVVRRLLEALAASRREGLTIALATASELVRRDARLLGELARRHRVEVALDGAGARAARTLWLRGVQVALPRRAG